MKKPHSNIGRRAAGAAAAIGLLCMSLAAWAHNPMAQCLQVDANTIKCKGGFSDGSEAPGVTLDVISYDEQILVPGKLADDSTLTFKKPAGEFYVLFDAGPGHVVEIDHSEIQE
ncbi:hypothetical protein [Pollutimonas bauzanensis]|uniref:Uncharacterized protein n=1 Tax=Pollutimonas bauzanensis TaxID=658167 RepID=A0A1M6A7I9_9BURK|nr:hypothetical protein [Pollutimonas bauzanensis]SHI32438.1 hypothetical protein SAMN04488135_12142 [Pollutimonas bauzanensis]